MLKYISCLLLLGGFLFPQTSEAKGCSDHFVSIKYIEPAMSQYFVKLRSTMWEGIQPFEAMLGKKIYLSRAFESLPVKKKKRVLELLLLGYGEFRPLLHLLPKEESPQKNLGAMLPFEVYTSDGRVVSYPYNACNRLLVLNEYQRERLPFFGIKLDRIQRYPMRRAEQERIKKFFWEHVGYDKSKAGAYWISWVPEAGYFEIDVPTTRYQKLLQIFFNTAPGYYYTVVVNGSRHKTYYQGLALDE